MALTPAQPFKSANIANHPSGGFEVQLEGRPIHTPKGAPLILPTRALAKAIAEEWSNQGGNLNPARLPLTRLANSAIDGVSQGAAQVAQDILNYASTDLLCYRASYPPELVAQQARLWDPILAFIYDKFGAHFVTCAGVQPLVQPQTSLETIKAEISPLGPFKLAALHVMTFASGSALIALAHVNGFLDDGAAWAAAEADADWQALQWGEDYDAKGRQDQRFGEFKAASRLFKLA